MVKTCSGCSSKVSKPIICDSCKIASYSSCLLQTDHPFCGDKFISCKTDCLSIASASQNVSLTKVMIRDIIRHELNISRDEDIRKLENDFSTINDRVSNIESKTFYADKFPNNSVSNAKISLVKLPREKEGHPALYYSILKKTRHLLPL
ncbi:hypothetical protein M0802_003411 [Mischocyttarus mexicanus]|nr:hypothetical protein M0802_003411 [Mischocyttarus mexicanus]